MLRKKNQKIGKNQEIKKLKNGKIRLQASENIM